MRNLNTQPSWEDQKCLFGSMQTQCSSLCLSACARLCSALTHAYLAVCRLSVQDCEMGVQGCEMGVQGCENGQLQRMRLILTRKVSGLPGPVAPLVCNVGCMTSINC